MPIQRGAGGHDWFLQVSENSRVACDPEFPNASRLFSEEPTRVIVSFAKERLNEVRAICARHEVPFESIGEVGGETVSIESCLDVSVTELAEAHHRYLEPIVGS
jgi:hypothetical protein